MCDVDLPPWKDNRVSQKPTDSEEEYFRKQEQEKKKQLAEKLAQRDSAKATVELKELHYMHCPKCGNDLETIAFKGVDIDKCSGCDGVWLDDGELEKLAGKESGFLSSLLGSFRGK